MERPVMRVSGPTLDAADPIALAAFYERLLGWPIVRRQGPQPGNPPTDGWAMLRALTAVRRLHAVRTFN